jgi:predicted metal-dependent peptidase
MVRDNKSVTINAMICSAGAFALRHPVYDLEYQINYNKAEKICTHTQRKSKEMKGTYKCNEHVKGNTHYSHATQKRHKHAQC